MRKLLYILVSASLWWPATAAAHPRAHLSMARGEAMIRAHAMLDTPSRVILSRCHRDSAGVACWVTEIGAHTLIEDNGQLVVGDLSYEGTAR